MSNENSLTPQPPLPLRRRGGDAVSLPDWEPERRRGATAAKELRRRETRAEAALWEILRGRKVQGLKFRRQHPIQGWVLDFACIENKLGIEIDGSVHDDQFEDDARRTESLEEFGYQIIRFSNDQVLNEPNQIVELILGFIGPQSNDGEPSDSDVVTPSPAERERGPGGEGRRFGDQRSIEHVSTQGAPS